jgi:hypothetical protein
MIASLLALTLCAMPSYGLWAYLSSQALLHKAENATFSLAVGPATAVLSLLISACFVLVAARGPR